MPQRERSPNRSPSATKVSSLANAASSQYAAGMSVGDSRGLGTGGAPRRRPRGRQARRRRDGAARTSGRRSRGPRRGFARGRRRSARQRTRPRGADGRPHPPGRPRPLRRLPPAPPPLRGQGGPPAHRRLHRRDCGIPAPGEVSDAAAHWQKGRLVGSCTETTRTRPAIRRPRPVQQHERLALSSAGQPDRHAPRARGRVRAVRARAEACPAPDHLPVTWRGIRTDGIGRRRRLAIVWPMPTAAGRGPIWGPN